MPTLYILSFIAGLIYQILYIFSGFFIFKQEKSLRALRPGGWGLEFWFCGLVRALLISPYNLSFLFLYLLFRPSYINFKGMGLQYLVVILIFRLPLWYLLNLFGLVINIVSLLNQVIFPNRLLTYKGRLSELNYGLKVLAQSYVRGEELKYSMALETKRIYIQRFYIRFNGNKHSGPVAKGFAESLPSSELRFSRPYVVRINDQLHQAFRLGPSSNFFCVWTSKAVL